MKAFFKSKNVKEETVCGFFRVSKDINIVQEKRRFRVIPRLVRVGDPRRD